MRGSDERSSPETGRRRRPTADPRLRRARVAVSAIFLVQGLTGGAWMARIPAVKAQAHLSDATLGSALFAVPVGLMLGAAAAERVVDRVGSARAAWTCAVGGSLLVMMPGLAGNLPELIAALFAFGFAGGMWDVAQNAQGIRVEAAYGRPVITSMHACYSLGAILGALAGGGFAWANIGPFPSLAAVGAFGALIAAAGAGWLLPATPEPRPEPAPASIPQARVPPASPPPATPPPAGAPPATVPSATVPPANLPPESALPEAVSPVPTPRASPAPQQAGQPARTSAEARRIRRRIIAIGVIGICALVGEGAAGDWSAVYLKDNLGTSAGFAALGFAAFSVTMTAGRALGDRLIHRFGVVPVARASALLAVAGQGSALVITSPWATLAGYAVLGAGLSVLVPQAFAAGGRADPDRPGSGIAKVVGLGYAGLSAGPAVIGLAASQIGLRLALAIPAVLAAWIVIGAPALRVTASQDRPNGTERMLMTPQAPASPSPS